MTFMPEKWVLCRLYALAETHLGYFSTSQAEELGVDRRYLSHHVRSENLERVGRGVYRLRNYPDHPFEDVMARSCGSVNNEAATRNSSRSARMVVRVVHTARYGRRFSRWLAVSTTRLHRRRYGRAGTPGRRRA